MCGVMLWQSGSLMHNGFRSCSCIQCWFHAGVDVLRLWSRTRSNRQMEERPGSLHAGQRVTGGLQAREKPRKKSSLYSTTVKRPQSRDSQPCQISGQLPPPTGHCEELHPTPKRPSLGFPPTHQLFSNLHSCTVVFAFRGDGQVFSVSRRGGETEDGHSGSTKGRLVSEQVFYEEKAHEKTLKVPGAAGWTCVYSRCFSQRFFSGRGDLPVAVDHLDEEPDLQADDGHVHHDLGHDGGRFPGGCTERTQPEPWCV